MTDWARNPSRIDLGITVMPEYVQSEGIEAVLERVCDVAGARSITTSPYVVAKADPQTGQREPPIDAGAGKTRLLDRPLWGKREVWMHAAPSFVPTADLYDGLAYRPPAPDEITERDGPIVRDFLVAAKGRGLETWLQIMAAVPPCHRVQFGGPTEEDTPRMPDGSAFQTRVDNNASLAAPNVRRYVAAILKDLCAAYPEADGFKFDWPEYPVYHFEALFFDFNPAVKPIARAAGLDFDHIRQGAQALLSDLGGVCGRRIAVDSFAAFRQNFVAAYPVVSDLIALRTALVEDFATFLRSAVDEASGGTKRVFLQCFPPPLNIATGFDFARVGRHCDAVGVKAYTMHWPVIERNILSGLEKKTALAPRAIARTLSALLELSDDAQREPSDIRYPGSTEPHPAPSAAITSKMCEARAAVPAGTRVVGLTHGYGPIDDVMRRFDAVAAGTSGAVHVNRYAYLSNEKLEAVGGRVRAFSADVRTEATAGEAD